MEQTNKGNKMKSVKKQVHIEKIMGKVTMDQPHNLNSPMVQYTMEQMHKMSIGSLSNLSILIQIMETKNTKET